ncbi:MAG: DUF559 domain-containing protein [Solirubrobacterales bacterium]
MTTHRDSIPVTTIQRTIEDLAATSLAPHLIRRAQRQAELKGHRLEGVESDRTRSDLETLFLEICANHELPSPEVNVRLGDYEVDFLWRSQCVVVETDFWAFHRGSVAFYADSERDLEVRLQGYEVLRFTDRELEGAPARVAALVRRALEG